MGKKAQPEMPSFLSVAIVSTQRDWHGGEEQARLLALGLRQRGCRCTIFARRGGAMAERLLSEGFPVISFAGSGRSPAAMWRIRQALRRLKPEILHYNDSHALSCAGPAAMGLPVAGRVAARRVDFPLRSPRIYHWFCDRLVCVSRAVAEVCRRGGLAEERLRVVYDGVDPTRVLSGNRRRGRLALQLAEEDTLLLTIAKLTDHKGHRFLLDAMPEVLQHWPRVLLALAGDGELRAELEQQCARLGISSRVRFLSFRQDAPDLLHAADLFVLPSHLEGLCSTLIDAMLAERTIVATTAGGIPEVVGGAGPGGPEAVAWLVPPRDPQALAQGILQALAAPEKCAAMRQAALRRAKKHFTAERMVEATLAVYEELLLNNRRSRRTAD